MPRLSLTTGITTLALLSSLSFGLPDDREQPINIQSDTAEQKMLEGRERTLYKGNVIMTQGSLNIKGDSVTVHSEDRSVTRIIATGELAFFSQKAEQEKPPIEARAKTIEYQLKLDTITMTNNASLTQGGSTVSGERIDYNTLTSQVKAAGNTSASESATNGRVNMILEPARKTEDEDNNKPDATAKTIEPAAAPEQKINPAKLSVTTDKAPAETQQSSQPSLSLSTEKAVTAPAPGAVGDAEPALPEPTAANPAQQPRANIAAEPTAAADTVATTKTTKTTETTETTEDSEAADAILHKQATATEQTTAAPITEAVEPTAPAQDTTNKEANGHTVSP